MQKGKNLSILNLNTWRLGRLKKGTCYKPKKADEGNITSFDFFFEWRITLMELQIDIYL